VRGEGWQPAPNIGSCLGGFAAPHAHAKVNEAPHQQAIGLDSSGLEPLNLEELLYHLQKLAVDIDGTTRKLRVFCE